MEFCLKRNTISINIINPIAGDVVKRIIFFGDIPANIRKIINSRKFSENEVVLKDYFGKRWKEKLQIKANTKTLRASIMAKLEKNSEHTYTSVHQGKAQSSARSARTLGGTSDIRAILSEIDVVTQGLQDKADKADIIKLWSKADLPDIKALLREIKVEIPNINLPKDWKKKLKNGKFEWQNGDEKGFIMIRQFKDDVPSAKRLHKKIKGSAEYSKIDSLISRSILYPYIPDEPLSGEIGTSRPTDRFDGFDFDLENITNTVIEENTDTLKDVNYDESIDYITNIILFPEDTFWTLKEKIYLATNIPVYRQYIYQIPSENEPNIHKTVHSIFVSDLPYQIDTRNDTESFYGVNIDKNLYNNRENLRIKTKESYKMIDAMMIDTLYLVDLQFYREQITNPESILESTYNMDVLFYGLFKKYFPIFNRDMMAKYLTDESKVLNEYPLINSNRATLEAKYNTEKAILLDVYNKIDSYYDRFADDIELAISEIYYKSLDQYSVQNGVFIRNLVDLFQCNENIPFIECYNTKNNAKYRIVKYFKNQPESLINEILENKTYKIIDEFSIYFWDKKFHQLNRFVINANASYGIIAKYLRSDNVDFTDSLENLMEYVNPFIERINENRKMVFNPNFSGVIPLFGQETTSVASVKVNMKWNTIVTPQTFGRVSEVLEQFYKSGMASHRALSVVTPNIINIRIRKGVTQNVNKFFLKKGIEVKDYYIIYHDIKSNDIWNLRYGGKNINIENNLTDITFEFLNIADKEFIRIINYIMYIINFVEENKTSIKNTAIDTAKKQSAMKKMKALDPKLYNFAVPGSNKPTKYSRICQKKFRPTNIYNEEEFSLLPKEKQAKLHQFINYTTGEPVWYECPSSLPYLGFITNKHPMGFCIPKCKATETRGAKNKAIMDNCKNKFKFEKTTDSTGMLKFGKHLPPGKIGFLHEKIYEMIGMITGDNAAYLFMKGVPGSYAGVLGSRILCCFAEQSGLSETMIINRLIESIKDKSHQSSKSSNQTNGDSTDIVQGVLSEMLKGDVAISEDMGETFKRLIEEVFGVHFIYINVSIAVQNEILNLTNSDIYITMDNSCSEYIKLKQNIKVVILLRLYGNIYPVLLSSNQLNKVRNEGYASKDRAIKQTIDTEVITGDYTGIFDSESTIVKALHSAISRKIMVAEREIQNKLFSYISLKNRLAESRITDFTKYISGKKIKYIVTAKGDKAGICVGVSNSINIVEDSDKGNIVESHDIFSRKKYNLPFKKLADFLSSFKSIHPIILVLRSGGVTAKSAPFAEIAESDIAIGMRLGDVQCWFNDTKLSDVLNQYKDAKCQLLVAEPSDVNAAITKRSEGKKKYLRDMNETYYNMYIYRLIKYEIFKYILLWRDDKLRKFLIKEMGTKTFVEEMNSIKVHNKNDYYKILNTIRNTTNPEKALNTVLLNHDIDLIIEKFQKISKEELKQQITAILDLISIRTKAITGEIGNTIASFIDYSGKKIAEFPHKEDLFYRNNRIKILADKYKIIEEKLLQDLSNKLLFTNEINNFNIFFIINYFHFVNVPGSSIHIQFL